MNKKFTDSFSIFYKAVGACMEEERRNGGQDDPSLLVVRLATLDAAVSQLKKEQDKIFTKEHKLISEPEFDIKQQRINELVSWFQTHAPESGVGSMLSFKTDMAEGTGVIALKDIPAGESVLRVPRSLMITVEACRKDPVLSPVSKAIPILLRQQSLLLALALIKERFDTKSFYTPYINTLPSFVPSIAFSHLDAIHHLGPSSQYTPALLEYKRIIINYAMIVHLLQHNKINFPPFSFQTWQWAYANVLARQNPIPSIDRSTIDLAMIPGFDMFNHEYILDGEINTHYNDTDDCCETTSLCDTTAGKQVFIYYGHRTPAEYTLYQGFLPAEVPGSLDLIIPYNNPIMAPLRASMRTKCGLTYKDMKLPLLSSSSGDHNKALLDYISSKQSNKADDESNTIQHNINNAESIILGIFIDSLPKDEFGSVMKTILSAEKALSPEDKLIPSISSYNICKAVITEHPTWWKIGSDKLSTYLAQISAQYTYTPRNNNTLQQQNKSIMPGCITNQAVTKLFDQYTNFEHSIIQQSIKNITE